MRCFNVDLRTEAKLNNKLISHRLTVSCLLTIYIYFHSTDAANQCIERRANTRRTLKKSLTKFHLGPSEEDGKCQDEILQLNEE